MHEAQWKGVAEEIQRLKTKPEYNVNGEIKWRFFGADNQDPRNTVRHLSQEKRFEFRKDFLDILLRRNSIKVISCVASVAASYEHSSVRTEDDLYGYTYKTVTERFQYFLQDMSRTVGAEQLGIVVADHRDKNQDAKLRYVHHDIIESEGPFTSKYRNFIETIFLTPSHLSVGIQFADMVAGAIGRKFNSGDNTFYDIVEPLFRKSSSGRIEGFGLCKFPNRTWR